MLRVKPDGEQQARKDIFYTLNPKRYLKRTTGNQKQRVEILGQS